MGAAAGAPAPDPPGTLRPVGTTGVLVAVGDDPGPAAVAAAVRHLAGELDVEAVPGAATVLVVATAGAAVARRLAAAALGAAEPGGQTPAAAPVEVPVVYDGEDLDAVAVATGWSREEVVARHSGAAYRVACCGFAPGFAYLEGLPGGLRVGRRAVPRPRVPAGSVAIADRWSAVYPSASPGGWQLLGRTDLPVWDPGRRPPALLVPGTAVRFRPVPSLPGPAGGHRTPAPVHVDGVHLVVLDPGPLTLVEDAGRPGLADQGVAPSGWLDPAAATLANRLVGNRPGAALLEVAVSGPRLRLVDPTGRSRAVAATGAAGPLTVDGRPAPDHAAVEVPAGAVVALGPCAGGVRAWLAVAGGVDAAPVLGSRSTDLLGGLGPAPLRSGDLLALGPDTGVRPPVGRVPVRVAAGPVRLRIHPGPRLDWLADDALEVLRSTPWLVGAHADRAGLRLDGARLAWRGPGELAPEGVMTGALQVPPSGQPVLLLADHPTTGGYPVAAVVDPADVGLAARLGPGAALRLDPVPTRRGTSGPGWPVRSTPHQTPAP